MNDILNKSIKEHFKLKVHAQNDFPNSIKNISEILIQTLSNENKLMWCGNGAKPRLSICHRIIRWFK